MAEGLTIDEFNKALSRETDVEGIGKTYHVLVADHKTNLHEPSSVFLDQFDVDLMRLYLKQYRASSDRDKFFINPSTLDPYTSMSGKTGNYQVRHGLRKITSTEIREATETCLAMCPQDKVEIMDAPSVTAHSSATARAHYQTGAMLHLFKLEYERMLRCFKNTAPKNPPGTVAPSAEALPPSVEAVAPSTSNCVDDGASVCSSSSISTLEGHDLCEVQGRVMEAILRDRPVTPVDNAPGMQECWAIVRACYPTLEDDDAGLFRKVGVYVKDQWRESRLRLRVDTLSKEFPKAGVSNDDVLRYIKCKYPHWGNPKKTLSLLQ